MSDFTDRGTLIQMQNYSIHDGDGVRTTIFLAGCHLRCQWCANPESWTQKKKMAFYRHKCKNCEKCVEACPQGLDPRNVRENIDRCLFCGECVRACPNQALDIACLEMTAEEIVEKIKREAIFFRYTGGGVTFSGGEPFLQHDFLRTLVNSLFDAGIGMWVETCGFFQWDKAKDIVNLLDHVFFDLKCMDPEKHKKYTGMDNEVILENAVKIYELNIPMTIRIPAIIEVNMDRENIEATAKFMSDNLKGSEIELLPYHELGKAKYISFGMEDKFNSFTTPTREQIEAAYKIFRSYGVRVAEYR